MDVVTDPATGRPLPPETIQRVLFIVPKVHIYNIPPLASTKGYSAASWTANNNERLIFTARLRILETALPPEQQLPSSSALPAGVAPGGERITITILLEDPSSGALFAAAPYAHPAAVAQAIDSSRFFAVRVVGDGGRKATLGVGFEERSDAFDFSIALQDARRVLGLEEQPAGAGASSGGASSGGRRGAGAAQEKEAEKRDFRLKEGETITVNIGDRGRRSGSGSLGAGAADSSSVEDANTALFSIKPPPSSSASEGGNAPFLPPPPSASEVRAERRRGRREEQPAQSQPTQPRPTQPQPTQLQPSASDLGFDDGEFGEFQ
ncbi:hypothetical protein BDY21DRAFT_282934 [Lineolata rhizophorae]|uniref:NECAP PHear domain-containing protein n=1 Tax=Lineolata rhizophorae TaxID=578093 RepID=A0A6A6P504_9PEZI|nr:hypothetical protein BDY21DRAFT_282934 [Lineolata rhizophorae]